MESGQDRGVSVCAGESDLNCSCRRWKKGTILRCTCMHFLCSDNILKA